MIEYRKGDLLESEAEALVNAVNTVGIMGKGIALQFKQRFPQNYKVYRAACKNEELAPGKLLSYRESTAKGDKVIINFPTKTHWKLPSEYRYIEDGLQSLAKLVEKDGIKSIAVPALGCGNGGLDWEKVRKMIEEALSMTDAIIIVYEPV